MTQDQIYEEIGITGAREEVKQKILSNILATVEGRLTGIIDDLMSEDQAKDLGRITDSNDIDAVVAWLQNNMPDVAEMYSAVLEDYIAELKIDLEGDRGQLPEQQLS